MTEYELSDLMSASISNSSQALATIISVVSAYIAVAWLVGAKLSKAQVTIINTTYLVFISGGVFGWWIRMKAALYYRDQILLLNPEREMIMTNEVVALATIVFFIIILFSLKFMWDVRHAPPK